MARNPQPEQRTDVKTAISYMAIALGLSFFFTVLILIALWEDGKDSTNNDQPVTSLICRPAPNK